MSNWSIFLFSIGADKTEEQVIIWEDVANNNVKKVN